MRFFASAAALPSAAATGLARDAKRGCCGAKRPLATATSSAQLKANMICAFFFAQITATRGLSAAKGHHASKSPAYWLALPKQHESVLTAHEADFAVYRFLEKPRLKYVSRARSRAEFEYASRRCFELSLGEPQSPFSISHEQGTVLRVVDDC